MENAYISEQFYKEQELLHISQHIGSALMISLSSRYASEKNFTAAVFLDRCPDLL